MSQRQAPPPYIAANGRTFPNSASAASNNNRTLCAPNQAKVNRTQQQHQHQQSNFQNNTTHVAKSNPQESRPTSHNQPGRHFPIPDSAASSNDVVSNQGHANQSNSVMAKRWEPPKMHPRKRRRTPKSPGKRPAAKEAAQVAEWNKRDDVIQRDIQNNTAKGSREELWLKKKRQRASGGGDQSRRPAKHARTQHSFDGGEIMDSALSSDATNSNDAQVHHSSNYQARVKTEEDLRSLETKEGHASSNSANKVTHGWTAEEMGSEQDIIDLTADPDKTHVIFAIDFSSSMKKKDVKMSNGRISRWEAVFECVDSFLTQQLQQQRQSGAMSTCLVSVLIFNNNSQVILNRTPLIGEGNNIREALKRAKTKRKPEGGTGFSAGFQEAEQLALSHIHDKVILVFLSDGRPGDLRSNPPPNPTTAMQPTFKRNGVTFPAAGRYIESMQKRHDDFSLQLICLYNEGVQWLKYLASRYNGIFHNPNLTMDDAAVAPQSCPPGHTEGDDSGSEEEEVVEIMKVKSQATLISERHQIARAAGEIVSLTNMSTEASSIRSTFSSISATVTAMRSSTKLQERAVTIKSESAMISYEATRMVLISDANGVDKFAVAPGESANERRIEVSMNPFARGGLRNVYRMKQKFETQQVAKESRHDIKYNERLKFHLETVKCQTQASLYASYFNKKIKNAMNKNQQGQQAHSLADVPRIDFLRAEVYRLKARSCPGGFRYLAVENHLEGNYEKWNNNDGFVNQSDCIKCKVAQAFSHFSYESSEQQKMVVDIQGSGNSNKCMYTDPQLHSVQKEFGRADRGTVGIGKFFATHECNFICQELGLPRQPGLL